MSAKPREMDAQKTAIEIRDWISMYAEKSGCGGVVIGLSGGVDSAVAAALCVDALGTDRVHGMILPCQSNEADLVDALTAAKHLGIHREVVDLTKTYEAMITAFKTLNHDLARANIKSRLRMTALYGRANQRNFLVCGTTNHPEQDVGYVTKYGDGGVDIEPIVDMLKREVRQMAAHKNFPDHIVNRIPTAGLWEGQTDEAELGRPYDRIDAAVEAIHGGVTDLSGEAKEDVEFVIQRIRSSEHKRQPPAMGPKVLLKE